MIKRTVGILLLIIACAMHIKAEENATAIMQRCADKFKAAPSVTAEFAIADAARPFSGTLTMSRSSFTLKSPSLSLWYDGKTQWAYITDNKEVNITEPTPDELLESNPFSVIMSFNRLYDCRKLKSTPGADIIELTPKTGAPAAIRLTKITISKSTGWPTALFLSLLSGQAISVSIKSVKVGGKLPPETFRFNKKAYPAAEVIDLR